MTADWTPLIEGLRGLRVLVVGDVILDEYLIGNATRLSREAPIPVLEFEERRLIPAARPTRPPISLHWAARPSNSA